MLFQRLVAVCLLGGIGYGVYEAREATAFADSVRKADALRFSPLFLEPALYDETLAPLRQNQQRSYIERYLGAEESQRVLAEHFRHHCPERVADCQPRFALREEGPRSGQWFFRGYCRLFTGRYSYGRATYEANWRNQLFPAVVYSGLKLQLEKTQRHSCAQENPALANTDSEFLVTILHATQFLVAYPDPSVFRAKVQPKLVFETAGLRLGWTLPQSTQNLPMRDPNAGRTRYLSSAPGR